MSRFCEITKMKLVLLVSFLWFIFTCLLVDQLRECLVNNTIRKKNSSERTTSALQNELLILKPYNVKQLKRWLPPRVLRPLRNKPGELGKAVVLTQELKEKVNRTFHIHQFAVAVSDLVSPNRSLIDTRDKECKSIRYPKQLPTTSVIIVFHNEAWSTLTRTVWSVINRSPRALLEEVILVDDTSDLPHLGKRLDMFMKTLPVPSTIIRMKSRLGLVNARIYGAYKARGTVLTFLDAHCECNTGWLEPLLARIVHSRNTVACPQIDDIDFHTFKYTKTRFGGYGGLDWGIGFIWDQVPTKEFIRNEYVMSKPIRSPTMAGGLFAMDREYFMKLGTYDSGMRIWGSENVEMSLRIWQCGGTVEIVPCSRVGHVYRTNTPHSFPNGAFETIMRNKFRLVDVWLDEWADFYYQLHAFNDTFHTDVGERKALRKRLQCKSFRWYLENIYPDTTLPFKYIYFGNIRNGNTINCIRRENTDVILTSCSQNVLQTFLYRYTNELINYGECLVKNPTNNQVVLANCTADHKYWTYQVQNKVFVEIQSKMCLTNANNGLMVATCHGNLTQQWTLDMPHEWQLKND